MDIRITRRENLRVLLREAWGNKRTVLADDLGYESANFVTKLLAESGSKSEKPIGHAVARKIERAAREKRGADWVIDGWLDVPHDTQVSARANKRGATLDERIAALPDALRNYVLLELDLCEQVSGQAAVELLRTPTRQSRSKFQAYLEHLAHQARPIARRSAA